MDNTSNIGKKNWELIKIQSGRVIEWDRYSNVMILWYDIVMWWNIVIVICVIEI